MFFDAFHDLIDRNEISTYVDVPIVNEVPILEMTQRCEQLFQRKLIEKVRKLKYLFKSYLKLIEDKVDVAELSALVEEPQPSLRAKDIGRRLKTGCEPRMNSQIRDYDMDFIIFHFVSYVNSLTRHT